MRFRSGARGLAASVWQGRKGGHVIPMARGDRRKVSPGAIRRFAGSRAPRTRQWLGVGGIAGAGETEMPLPRFAPPDSYQPGILLRMWRAESGGTKTNFYWATERRIGYFFRIRSQVNEAGQVKAAQYGKLVGGIAFRPRPDGQVSLSFQYYLNPAENDRNMENKLDSNLFPARIHWAGGSDCLQKMTIRVRKDE